MKAVMRRTAIIGLAISASFLTVAALAAADPGSASPQGQAKGQATAPGHNKSSPASNSAPAGSTSSPAPATSGPSSHQATPQNGEAFTSSQPLSNADQNGTGANQPGPYDASPHYAAAPNGMGDGQAPGKPCAGCVGQADNKNPGASGVGQMPSGAG